MKRLLVLTLAAAVLALVGCGRDADPAPVATALPGAPAMVRDRVPLPFCGREDVQLGGEGIDEGARACFADAWDAGDRAEFVTTSRTAEGDPVTQIFRSVGAGRIQVFVDNRRARFGGRMGWLVKVCREYREALPWASRCSPPTPL